MSLASDYFLLFHGISDIEQTSTYGTSSNKDKDEFFEISSLILTTTRRNFDKFILLNSFKELISKITNKELKTLDELYQLQFCLIEAICEDTKEIQVHQLHDSFEYLLENELIDQSDYNKLISLFDPEELTTQDEIDVKDEITVETKKPFKKEKIELDDLIFDLEELFTTQEFKNELKEVSHYLSNQKFSIGITGVMNAGKSTMLNALMGQEILGSAVVPETANLTIVKHGEPEARVFYWNKREWENIEKSADEFKSIKEFVDETKSLFGNELNELIKETSVSQSVDINNLAAYTSAEASGKKCNLVKYVELKSDLTFLSNGIEIVDTPGLDDPVIQREEITKEYLSQCDLMIHLMNVSQSATLKDVEFIIDALLYQNITKLLIVITRADTVNKEQLEEVINYTKSSIQRQLKEQNKDSKLDYILNSIQFIPISGKMALLHRTGKSKEAINAGFHLEDTGILDIEEYLEETLFGSQSTKTDLIIKGAKTKILKSVEKQLKSYNYELVLLSKSKEELEVELRQFNIKKEKNQKIFIKLKNDMNAYKKDAQDYIKNLDSFLNTELLDLQSVIKQRVFNDVKYSFEKTKKRPEGSRVKSIIQTAIKDGIIDIIRDYRYKFVKKSENIAEICEKKYKDLNFSISNKNDNFDAKTFFQDDFKAGFLSSSNEVLISKILNEVAKSKANKLSELDRSMETYIKEEFSSIEKSILQKANSVSKILIENFFEKIAEPMLIFEQKLNQDEETLQQRIKSFEDNEINKDKLTIEIHKKIKKLDSSKKRLRI